jgi:hypothetical protein
MLPAIVNGNLARGAFALSKKKAIVKRLDAIQNVGGMTVLCSDKVCLSASYDGPKLTLEDWHVDKGRNCALSSY